MFSGDKAPEAKLVPGTAEPRPSDEDVVSALSDIERASQNVETEPPLGQPSASAGEPNRGFWASKIPVIILLDVILTGTLVSAWWLHQKATATNRPTRTSAKRSAASRRLPSDPAAQAQFEPLLGRAVMGDAAAIEDVISQSADWTGKLAHNPKVDQLITSGLNSRELKVREACLQAQLALDGISKNEAGFNYLRELAGDPTRRGWALWILGDIGHAGVDAEHAAKIIGAYLEDPDANVRAAAVNGLAVLATDETVPMLLDRFRNDPSAMVQERAACALAESGMYTHEQRLIAASTLVSWTEDPLLNGQQRTWTYQALRDISGKTLASDPALWREWWYASAKQ